MTARLSRFRDKLSNLRLTLLVTLLFTMFVAAIFPTPALTFMVALLCASPFVGLLATQFMARSVTASRSLPHSTTVGEIVTDHITVSNRSFYPVFFAQFDLGVAEADAPRLPLQPIEKGPTIITLLGPHQRVELTAHWRAVRRGIWTLPRLRAGAGDPLGLSSALPSRTAPHTITVVPRPLPVARLGFLREGQSGHTAPSHTAAMTEAMNFYGIRQWQPGQSARRVHWPSTARTGHMHVVEWEEDLAVDLVVFLDVQVAPGHRPGAISSALETCITLLASIAANLLENGYSIDIFFWSTDSNAQLQLSHCQARGTSNLGSVLITLAGVIPLTDVAASLRSLTERAAPQLSANRNVLFITQHAASLEGPIDTLQQRGITARQQTALCIDPDLPSPPQTEVIATGASAHNSGVRRRFIRNGESLLAALEKS